MRKCVFSLVIVLALAASAGATPLTYQAYLSGPNEAPPNASPGIGYALVTIDPVANTLQIDAQFSGLLGTTSAAHIHCCTTTPFAGTAGVIVTPGNLVNFPLGVTAGSYSRQFLTTDTSTYAAAFITANGGTTEGAEAALIAGFDSGRAYFNIHTSVVPGGEIRGFLTPVPEPATLGLLALGLGAAAWRKRRQASRSAPDR
jgi:hypothetical protein